MAAERHDPERPDRLTWVAPAAAAARLEIGQPAGGADCSGAAMTGRVVSVRHGNAVAIVISEAAPCSPSSPVS